LRDATQEVDIFLGRTVRPSVTLLICVKPAEHYHQMFSFYTVFRKKHPLTFSFISQ